MLLGVWYVDIFLCVIYIYMQVVCACANSVLSLWLLCSYSLIYISVQTNGSLVTPWQVKVGLGELNLPMGTSTYYRLTHWGRVTHICVSKLIIISSDNGLSPGRRQAIIWTNAGILLIGPLGTNFNEILIEIHTFSFRKMHLKMLSGKRRPFCLGLNVLNEEGNFLDDLKISILKQCILLGIIFVL